MVDQIPPHDLEAEIVVLGGMLFDPDYAISFAYDLLEAEDFYRGEHQRLFKSMLDCFGQNGTVHPKLLPEDQRELAVKIKLEGHTSLIAPYCRLVADAAEKRRIIEAATRTARKGYEAGLSLDDLQASVQEIAAQVDRRGQQSLSVPALVDDELQGIGQSRPEDRVSTGIMALDQVLDGGLDKQWLFVLGARRSVGKTAFAANIAIEAMRAGRKLVWIAEEMSAQQMVRRFLIALSGVQQSNRNGEPFSKEEESAMAEAGAVLKGWNPIIEDRPLSIGQLYGRCRRWAAQGVLDFLVVDYLQIMKHDRGLKPSEAISIITRGAKTIAKEHNIPVLGVAQIRREGEYSKKRPILANLKGSGSLEEDADVVCLMWPGKEPRQIHAAIDKNRHGGTGQGLMFQDFAHMKFGDWYPGQEEVPDEQD